MSLGRRILLAACAGVASVAALLHAPAGNFAEPVRAALERSLGRKATFGAIEFTLWPGPGFLLSDVVIEETPVHGREPLAYCDEAKITLAWVRTLWGRHPVIDRVRLNNVSVNVAISESAGWNVAALLKSMTEDVRRTGAPPELEMRNGRINFRSGTLKSAYYLNRVDLDVRPAAEGFEWSYEGSPARTDRAEQGFGMFTAKGRWTPGGDSGSVDIDLELEPSVTSEVVTLFAGRDLGLAGKVSARGRLSGPLAAVKFDGALQFEGFQSSGLFSLPSTPWRLPLQGEIRLKEQRLLLDTKSSAAEALPVALALRVEGLLTNPDWFADWRFNAVRGRDFLEVVRRLGATTPAELELEGQVDGRVAFGLREKAAGQMFWKDVQASAGGTPLLSAAAAELRIGAEGIELLPAAVVLQGGKEVRAAGRWSFSGEPAEMSLTGARSGIGETMDALRHVPGATVPEVLSPWRKGVWSGGLHLKNGIWSGEMDISGADWFVAPGLAALRLERGQLRVKGDEFRLRRMRLRDQETLWSGELEWIPEQPRPLRFQLETEKLEADQLRGKLESWFGVRRGLLERALRLGRRQTARAPRAEGSLKIGEFRVAGGVWTQVRARLFSAGSSVEVSGLEAKGWEGQFAGRLDLQADREPRIRLRGLLENILLRGVRLDADVDLQMDEWGGAWRAEGQATARSLSLGEETARTVSACYDLSSERGGPRLRLRCWEAAIGAEPFVGTVNVTPDGRLQGEMQSARRAVGLSGSINPWQVQMLAR